VDLLRDCKRRGMTAPALAIGDGALGFWGALREVFPQTREQRCWFHKITMFLPHCRNRPPRCEEGARGDLERRGQDPRAGRGERVRGGLRREVPKGGRQDHRRHRAVARVLRLPRRALDPPAHHESESTFATVRNRSKITKGPGSRAQGIAMAYKLIEAAQTR
jgi:Transposase, Mutator family